MDATIIARTPASFTIPPEFPCNESLLEFEETLRGRLDQAVVATTAEGLRQFDTDGSPIALGSIKLASEGQVEKD